MINHHQFYNLQANTICYNAYIVILMRRMRFVHIENVESKEKQFNGTTVDSTALITRLCDDRISTDLSHFLEQWNDFDNCT